MFLNYTRTRSIGVRPLQFHSLELQIGIYGTSPQPQHTQTSKTYNIEHPKFIQTFSTLATTHESHTNTQLHFQKVHETQFKNVDSQLLHKINLESLTNPTLTLMGLLMPNPLE